MHTLIPLLSSYTYIFIQIYSCNNPSMLSLFVFVFILLALGLRRTRTERIGHVPFRWQRETHSTDDHLYHGQKLQSTARQVRQQRVSVQHGIRMTLSVLHEHQRCVATLGEMIHTASLIHDDVVDSSDRRRGKPTAAVKWGPKKVPFRSSTHCTCRSNSFPGRSSR